MAGNIAYFVTSHGFGHAARASAVMAAIHRRNPQVCFEIFTTTPRWFFEESLHGCFNYHEIVTDVGLVQSTPMTEDLPATLDKLGQLLPFNPLMVQSLADTLSRLGCRAVVCDISALGLAAANAAGLPAVLVENFTWDWIYEVFLGEFPAFEPFIQQFELVYRAADFHIQTEPVCRPLEKASLTTFPIYREPHSPPAQVRAKLGVPPGDSLVLVTMGGVPEQFSFQDRLQGVKGVTIVIPGGSAEFCRQGNLVLLPHHSEFYHPDLVFSSDAVVGKAGYSTIAETFHAGIPFGFISRARFRESGVLAAYIRREIPAVELGEAEFNSGAWVSRLHELLQLKRVQRDVPNGADQAADLILKAAA